MPDPAFAGLAGVEPASLALAFLVGGLTTYFDCYSALTSRIGRVPSIFLSNLSVIGLAVCCGLVATVACWWAGRAPDGVLATVLTLKAEDPFRGAVVGASVLVLIRSKLFNLRDSPFGGDFLYQFLRDTAIQDVNGRWTLVRLAFQNDNIAAALRDAELEAKLDDLIAAHIRSRPDAFRARFEASQAETKRQGPACAFDPADARWRIYYRTLLGIALDACGPAVIRRMPGFR